ncbi:MAG TPA: hypothetical protein VMS94_02205 [Acidobacteriota bacterium]|nr:hypothetical protein [Acidobacteriota bacterium]
MSEALPSYEPIWDGIEGKLEEYKAKFEIEWNTIHEAVLAKMSSMAKLPWKRAFQGTSCRLRLRCAKLD